MTDGAESVGSRSGDVPLGEVFDFAERLLVSPVHGVIHRRRVRVGRRLEPGVVLADVRSDGRTVRVGAPGPGTFLAWVVDEGERVVPGRILARIRADASHGSG